MRLARVGPPGQERPVVMTGESTALDLSSEVRDFTPGFFAAGGIAHVAQLLGSGRDWPTVDMAEVRVGPPISTPGKIVCIGLNYSDHAREAGMELPAEPTVFLKAPNALCGPTDDLQIPVGGTKTDWEVELAMVVGKRARYLQDPAEARDHIAGVTLSNDVSERSFQLERGGQWVKGKSCETFNPLGPWLVTLDEVPNLEDLDLWSRVNGTVMQTGSTSRMIFPVEYILWYLSQFMVLEPGDLINTGTPAGVGMGQTPPQYLTAGDLVEVGGERLGAQRQRCAQARV